VKVLARVSIPQGNLNDFSEVYKANLIKEYSNSFKRIDWECGVGYIEIYKNDKEYTRFIGQLQRDKIYFSQEFKAEYSKNEIDKSELLVLRLKYQCEMTYNGKYGMFFDEYANGCGVYTKQHSDLQILKRDLGQRDIFRSTENEYLVSIKLKSLIESEKLTGVIFRPVYTKKDNELIAYQMIIENKLPLLHEKTALEIANEDSRCNFMSYIKRREEPLVYEKETQKAIKDFNITSEYFGIGVFPRPIRIVSQKVRQILLKNKIKGIEFEPVFIVD
jgi:hypothetical protein